MSESITAETRWTPENPPPIGQRVQVLELSSGVPDGPRTGVYRGNRVEYDADTQARSGFKQVGRWRLLAPAGREWVKGQQAPGGIAVRVAAHPTPSFVGAVGVTTGVGIHVCRTDNGHPFVLNEATRITEIGFESEQQAPQRWTSPDHPPSGTRVRITDQGPMRPSARGLECTFWQWGSGPRADLRPWGEHPGYLEYTPPVEGWDLFMRGVTLEAVAVPAEPSAPEPSAQERLDALWAALQEEAQRRNWCSEYDEFASKHGGPRRVRTRQETVTVEVTVPYDERSDATRERVLAALTDADMRPTLSRPTPF